MTIAEFFNEASAWWLLIPAVFFITGGGSTSSASIRDGIVDALTEAKKKGLL